MDGSFEKVQPLKIKTFSFSFCRQYLLLVYKLHYYLSSLRFIHCHTLILLFQVVQIFLFLLNLLLISEVLAVILSRPINLALTNYFEVDNNFFFIFNQFHLKY